MHELHRRPDRAASPAQAGAAPGGTSLGPARTTGTWQTINRAAARVDNAAQLELLPGTRLTVRSRHACKAQMLACRHGARSLLPCRARA
jgi:hypothetical protein